MQDFTKKSRLDRVWEFVSGVAAIVGIALVIAGLGIAACSVKAWRYNECMAVGHSETYCQAEFVGCIGGR